MCIDSSSSSFSGVYIPPLSEVSRPCVQLGSVIWFSFERSTAVSGVTWLSWNEVWELTDDFMTLIHLLKMSRYKGGKRLQSTEVAKCVILCVRGSMYRSIFLSIHSVSFGDLMLFILTATVTGSLS